MKNPVIAAGRQQAYKLLLVQLSIVITGSLFTLIVGTQAALSVLSGGMTVVFPAFLFTRLVFAQSGARANKQVVRAFYSGEAIKMLLSAILVIIAFVLLSETAIFVLAGYLLALISQWLTPFVVKTQ